MDSRPRTLTTSIMLVLTAAAASGDEPALQIAATTPVVELAPRARGRFVRLPSLDFEFNIRPDYPFDLQPESVTLSIADTRKSIGASQIAAQELASITLQVPAKQVAPIAAADFCRLDTDDSATASDAGTEITIPAALTAHASLRCSGGVDPLITYVTHALDVRIRCAPKETETAETGSD